MSCASRMKVVALGQLPQRRGPDVGARRPDAAQEIEDGALHGPFAGTSTALPSLLRYSATPPACFVMATDEDMP